MPEPATYKSDVPEYILRSNAARATMVNAQGLKLATYEWAQKGDTVRGVVVVVHGVSSHTCYDWLRHATLAVGEASYEGASFHEPRHEGSWVARLNSEGYVVAGFDQQSYGLSEGLNGDKGYFASFDDLVADVVQFRKEVSQRHPGAPVVVMGISLGGCVVTRAVQTDNAFPYHGAVLIAPMLSLEKLKQKTVNKILLPVAGCVSRCFPRLRIAQKEDHKCKEMADHFMADPLTETEGGARARVAHECLGAVDAAQRDFPLFTAPLLTVHSDNDTMTDPDGSRMIVEAAGTTDKQYHRPAGEHLWHVYTQEPGQARVLDHVVAWVNERVKPKAAAEEADATA